MHAAVLRHRSVVLLDVGDDLGDHRETFLCDGAVLSLDLLTGDQFFAVTEAAMGRAGRNDVHESHLVLVQQALDGAVVHLVAGILRARKIHRLGGVGLDDALNRGAGPGQLVVMARDLHGHPGFNVTIGALERLQACHLILGVEVEHVFRRLLVEEGGKATDDFPLIAAFFDALEKLLLACGGDVGLWLCHCSGSIAGKELMSIDQLPISMPESPFYKSVCGAWMLVLRAFAK